MPHLRELELNLYYEPKTKWERSKWLHEHEATLAPYLRDLRELKTLKLRGRTPPGLTSLLEAQTEATIITSDLKTPWGL
jgi:hypothetical protein